MPVIDNIADTWTSVGPLATPEVWQCRAGAVSVTTETPGGSPHVALKPPSTSTAFMASRALRRGGFGCS